jgi:hypothetical protein
MYLLMQARKVPPEIMVKVFLGILFLMFVAFLVGVIRRKGRLSGHVSSNPKDNDEKED